MYVEVHTMIRRGGITKNKKIKKEKDHDNRIK